MTEILEYVGEGRVSLTKTVSAPVEGVAMVIGATIQDKRYHFEEFYSDDSTVGVKAFDPVIKRDFQFVYDEELEEISVTSEIAGTVEEAQDHELVDIRRMLEDIEDRVEGLEMYSDATKNRSRDF